MAESSSKSTSAKSPSRSVAANVKETLESIVVAFILAFVFRAFIVEAFIIPTGSMAVTLYGEQLTNTCSTCGYEYALGVTEDLKKPSYRGEVKLRCPNCATRVDTFKNERIRRPDSGDRILVHKWPFDIGGELLGPKRWDVVVFKNPRDGTMNYIKRLIGLPGEVLEIIDGDIYRVSLEKLEARHPGIVDEFKTLRKKIYQIWQQRISYNYYNSDVAGDYLRLNRKLLPLLEIQRKDPQAQRALWFNVYNHDFLPNYDRLPSHSLSDRVGFWPDTEDPAAAKAWDTSRHEMQFASDLDRPLYIRFSGKPIDDFCAYNNDGRYNYAAGDGVHPGSVAGQLVGDLRLRFTWFVDGGGGELLLEMNRDKDVFVADLRADGMVSLVGTHPNSNFPGHKQTIGQKKVPAFRPGQAVEVEFINLDYRVSLLIEGKEVIASNPEQYAPDFPDVGKLARMSGPSIHTRRSDELVLGSEVRIGARNIRCRLRHVVLERDVYYRSPRQEGGNGNVYHNWPCWGTAGLPIMLRGKPDREYFMLGDNSAASMDSRLWYEIGPHLRPLKDEYRLGTVTEDQLLGKAFFVYWPAGYRPDWAKQIGLIPNFGRMRWIR